MRSLIEAGQPVKLSLQLDYEVRQGLKAEVVWGTLPGQTDENIVVLAHGDGYFQAAVDNASGVAVMLGLAEHFSKIPRQQRRRTMTFFAPIGHHVTHDESLVWMHDNMRDFWQKTALILNAEHVATTQTYLFGTELRKSTAATAHRFYVARSKRLGELMVNAFKLFGVALYAEPGLRPSGDLNQLKDLAPGIEVIESNAFYHSDQDEGTVPAAGLESIARAYAKIIDEVNRLTNQGSRSTQRRARSDAAQRCSRMRGGHRHRRNRAGVARRPATRRPAADLRAQRRRLHSLPVAAGC